MDTEGFTDKASKNPEERQLYEEYDYITAYSKHTDLRIERDGFKRAIGSTPQAGQDWDEHGQLQLNFLISRGLTPEKTLLDFGCGTGRLACKAVPYLNPGNYTGADISEGCLLNCMTLAQDWSDKKPRFVRSEGEFPHGTYHLIWAHSVINHSPREIVERLFQQLQSMAFGEFCFTFKEGKDKRTGLKQFRHSFEALQSMAKKAGLKAEKLEMVWPASQKTARVWR